jgi:hypothetical protein
MRNLVCPTRQPISPEGLSPAALREKPRTKLGAWLQAIANGRRLGLVDAAFAILFLVNAVRLFRHTLYEDEVQAWVIARVSATPWALFHNLRYEGHPGLWHLLLWVVSRFTADPSAQQFVQLAVAAGSWFLIYRCAPFSWLEKFLLLLGYFLFFEYFVPSRNYGLMVLLGFGYIALRARQPERPLAPWLVLALLANTVVFGAIWSLALAMFLPLAQIASAGRLPRASLIGGLVYLAGFALAVATMMPAPDGNFRTPVDWFDFTRVVVFVDHFISDAFVPVGGVLLTDPASAFSGSIDNYWNPQLDLVAGVVGIGIVWAATILAAVLTCGFVARERTMAVIEPIGAVFLTFIGSIVFAYVWQANNSRHAGVLLLAVVGALWLLRVRRGGTAPRWWIALLAVNALGGLMTLQSELRPFSYAAAAAQWLKQNGYEHAFIMSAEDPQVAVLGYLDRPIYDLGCQCERDFIRWNHQREGALKDPTLTRRIASAVTTSSGGDDILVLNHTYAPAADAPFTAPLLQAFSDAELENEDFYIYRVVPKNAPRPAAGDAKPSSRSAS